MEHLTIRLEQGGDADAIRDINKASFGGNAEAGIVEALRRSGNLSVSLLALIADRPVGHIAFSPVMIQNADTVTNAIGLAPMAVLPPHQRKGIGSALVHRGLAHCRRLGHDLVIVLGHPSYYPRFGFVPASRLHLRWEHDAPDAAFMALALDNARAIRHRGVVRYGPEFAAA